MRKMGREWEEKRGEREREKGGKQESEPKCERMR